MLCSQFWKQIRDSNAWNYTYKNKKMGYMKTFAYGKSISYSLNRVEVQIASGISNIRPKS